MNLKTPEAVVSAVQSSKWKSDLGNRVKRELKKAGWREKTGCNDRDKPTSISCEDTKTK